MSDEAQPAVQMLLLERIDRASHMDRYYVLAVSPSLLGDTALVREWGRTGTSVRRRIELHASQPEAEESLRTWLRRKTKRGYVVAHRE